jgi:hypothetical protein
MMDFEAVCLSPEQRSKDGQKEGEEERKARSSSA